MAFPLLLGRLPNPGRMEMRLQALPTIHVVPTERRPATNYVIRLSAMGIGQSVGNGTF
jgi:hypothetical protein